MNWLWRSLIMLSVMVTLLCGNAVETAAALLASGESAVKLLLTLLGTMTMWSGLMEILQATGDVARMGAWMRRLLRPLFPGLRDDEAWQAVSLNLSANVLGLGNAATPAGIAAARRLATLGQPGLQALAMLLVLDHSGLQLMPTTVITLRASAGSVNAAGIWPATLLSSLAATLTAVLLLTLCRRWRARRE